MLRAYLLISSLLISVVTAIPTALAHDCMGEDPASQCGDCTEGDHDHRYFNGVIYCSSGSGSGDPIPCLPVFCQVKKLVDDIT